ncbi:MAG: tetratricopeptide repeat protein [Ectothiorhodospiraceae bacterium]|nr:tetratricopeptide repeat protein [Ectothiorhodospiraceae bacterium]
MDDTALDALRAQVEAQPDDSVAWLALADGLRESWLLAEAGRAYLKARTLDPELAVAWAGQAFVQALRGKPTDALESCGRALRLRSNLAVAHRHRATALSLLGRDTEAAQAAAEARRLDPDTPQNAVALAAAWSRVGLRAGARRLLDRVIDEHPDLAEAWVNRALLKLSGGDTAGASADLDAALARKPWLPPALALRARLQQAAGQTAAALASIERACQRHPDSEDYHILRLELLSALGRHAEAFAQAETGLRHWPESRVMRAHFGRMLLEQGRIDEARRRIPGLRPQAGTAEVWQALGDAWLACERREVEAHDCLRRALAATDEPQNALRRQIAGLCLVLGRADEALSLIDALDPADAETALLRADDLERLQRMDEAIACLRAATEVHPDDARIRLRLAQMLRRQGDAEAALPLLDRALAIDDGNVAVHAELGFAFSDLERLAEAEAPMRAALRLAPDNTMARFNLAVLLLRLRRWPEAEPLLRGVLRQEPHNPRALGSLAQALLEQKRFDEACELVEPMLESAPDDSGLRLVLFNAHHGARRLDAATEVARAWTTDQPACAMAWTTLARVLAERHDPAADAAAARAWELEPDTEGACETMGLVAAGLARHREALEWFDRGLAIRPDTPSLLANRAFAVQELEGPEAAIAGLARVVELEPESHMSHMNLALSYLRCGRLAEGWRHYKRRESAVAGSHALLDPRNLADDELRPDLSDATVLVRCEQGLGDTIQFLRYVPMLAAQAREVLLHIQDGLAWMAFGLAPNLRVFGYRDPLPAADHEIALLSLPRWFGTELDGIPQGVPYIHADPARVAHWRQHIGDHIDDQGFRIGIVWHTNPAHGNVRRWIPLRQLAPLSELPGVRLISLQKYHGLDQLDALDPAWRVETLPDDFDAGPDAFADAAAVMHHLDLVIGIDTSMGHLAGALGRPVWTLLNYSSDWRWLTGRDDSPWYPSLRLFRQPAFDDWDSVVVALRSRLERVLAGESPVIWPTGE